MLGSTSVAFYGMIYPTVSDSVGSWWAAVVCWFASVGCASVPTFYYLRWRRRVVCPDAEGTPQLIAPSESSAQQVDLHRLEIGPASGDACTGTRTGVADPRDVQVGVVLPPSRPGSSDAAPAGDSELIVLGGRRASSTAPVQVGDGCGDSELPATGRNSSHTTVGPLGAAGAESLDGPQDDDSGCGVGGFISGTPASI